MSDLISRNALCEFCLNTKDRTVDANDIMRFPSAEPERTAKVVHKSDTYVVTPPKTTTTSYETRTNLWEECGNCHMMGMYHGWNYCPKCGVKLDWSEDE